MTPDVLQRADELIAAHNEAREQRGKTMTDQSETERQVEQVLSQLTSWVKQQAKANASSQQVIADYKAVMDAQRAEIETLRAMPTASSDRDSIERDAWQRRAKTWKAVAKRVKEDRDIAVETWGSWHSEAIRLKFQLSEAQQRIAELETAVRVTDGANVIKRIAQDTKAGPVWRQTGKHAYDLTRDGHLIACVRRTSPGVWGYETDKECVASFGTANNAMRAAEAALGVEVTR